MADHDVPRPRPRPPPNRRRDKPRLSCDRCRRRKLRCDRKQPCGACLKRSLNSSCHYATLNLSAYSPDNIESHDWSLVAPSPSPLQQQQQQQQQSSSSSASLNGRICELENLVVALLRSQQQQQQPPPPPPLPSSPAPTPPIPNTLSSAAGPSPSEVQRSRGCQDEAAASSPADPGTLKMHESGTNYIQSVHWEAILTKIRGLKEDLVPSSKVPPGSQFFYGPNRHATRDEVLAAVPSRPVVDRLMALHFDTYMITPYIIHSKRFHREYETFWENPWATSIAWISLMFSMLYIAAQLQICSIDVANERAESLRTECIIMKDTFRDKAVQCLILARYTTGGPYILETLIMILTGEFTLLKDGATDGWLLGSMILHIAMRMGYHRDPSHFPGLSSFDGEMRRRVWTVILQFDVILSLETGLPRNATDAHIDTKPPLNLRDWEFDEDTTEMPPPRPETEWTPVLALIARGRLIKALGLVCDVNTNINPPSDEEMVKIDEILQDVHNRVIPSVLRWETTSHPITDSPSLVIQRVSVQTTYHKSRILLHRRALISHPSQQFRERDKESVRICLDSALRILSFQKMLHEESQPFGRLCQLRWKVAHIFNLDVLLATSMLCLYLQDVGRFEWTETERRPTRSPTTEDIRRQLATSHNIWLQMSTSPVAAKVAKALSIVLGNPDPSIDTGSEPASGDFLTDIEAMPLYQGFNSAVYSPLAFFDNILETQGT